MKIKKTKMFTPATFKPGTGFLDPRLQPDFESRLWPLCNGKAAPPPDTRGLYERRCLEFLAAFYRINVANQRLLEARKGHAAKKALQTRLNHVERATAELETLEDRYAPIGFFGEPVMDGLRYHDVKFIRPEVPKQFQPKTQTMSFMIPGLDAIPRSEFRGPPRLRRFSHAKLDL